MNLVGTLPLPPMNLSIGPMKTLYRDGGLWLQDSLAPIYSETSLTRCKHTGVEVMYTWSKRNHINTTTLALGTLIACTGVIPPGLFQPKGWSQEARG